MRARWVHDLLPPPAVIADVDVDVDVDVDDVDDNYNDPVISTQTANCFFYNKNNQNKEPSLSDIFGYQNDGGL